VWQPAPATAQAGRARSVRMRPDNVEVDQRSRHRRDHHRNTNRYRDEAHAPARWMPNVASASALKPIATRNPADRNHRRARALQDDKEKTRHADKPTPAYPQACPPKQMPNSKNHSS